MSKYKNGKGLHYSSHFYFYYVIKKDIKKHRFLSSFQLRYEPELTGQYLEFATAITVAGETIFTQPQQMVTHINPVQYATPQFVLEANGDANFTGTIHALGTVRYNQEISRLEFWDGQFWIPINI